MQIYFHRQLFSHLSRVPILVEGTVYIYIYIQYIYIYIYILGLGNISHVICMRISSVKP